MMLPSHTLIERKSRQQVGKRNKGFILEMKILICDLRRAVQDIFCFWGGTSWVDSHLKSLAGMQFKSLEEPFSTGSCGPKSLKCGCHLGRKEHLVLFLPTRFKGSLS